MIEQFTKPSYLSEKYFIFCEAYIRTNNAAESARQAGYSKKTAGIQGCTLLKHPKIKRYLQERAQDIRDSHTETIASTDEVLEYLTSVMRGEITDYNRRGAEIPISIADRTVAAQELAKRLFDMQGNDMSNPVQIVIDIPQPVLELEGDNVVAEQ